MADQRLAIYYPSGNTLSFFGRFIRHGSMNDGEPDPLYVVFIEALESTFINGQLVSPGSIVFLDPRSVIIGGDGVELYSPRPHVEKFPSYMREWMQQNPQWPENRSIPTTSV